jgi:hypothetical protein
MADETSPPEAPEPAPIRIQLALLAVTFIEMQQGLRPVNSLDAIASNAARRRIRALTVHSARPRRQKATRTAPVTVLRVRATQPSAGVIEGTAVIATDDRVRCLAIRLEHRDDGWTLVEIAPPGDGLKAAITPASGEIREPALTDTTIIRFRGSA